jgi:hypothetical protein
MELVKWMIKSDRLEIADRAQSAKGPAVVFRLTNQN